MPGLIRGRKVVEGWYQASELPPLPATEAGGFLYSLDGGADSAPTLVLFDGTRWEALYTQTQIETLITALLNVFSFAAYGAMALSTPAAFSDLGAAWQPLDVFDTADITPRGLVLDPAQGTFTVEHRGVYQFVLNGSLEHDSSNQGRTTRLRLYDVTDGVPAPGNYGVGIGRNVTDTVLAVNYLFEFDEDDEGHVFRLDIGGGDAVADVVFNVLQLSLYAISEWQKPIEVAHGTDLVNP